MIFDDFSIDAKNVVRYAKLLAKKSGGIMGTEHLLAGILRGDYEISDFFLQFNITADKLEATFDILPPTISVKISDSAMEALNRSARLATTTGCNKVQIVHILLGLLETKSKAIDYLGKFIVDVNGLYGKFLIVAKKKGAEGNQEEVLEENDNSPDFSKIGQDLTEKAKQGKIDPVIGRDNEIERMIQILSRRTKNNPILIGEAGVGKTAVVEGLALAIVENKVPDDLRGKRILSLDMSAMVAGTKYRGEFEEKLKSTIDAITKAGNVILFIDEIHTLVNAGGTGEGGMDCANILKPLWARGELQTIGATTFEEYHKYFEKDNALERRFQSVTVKPPSIEATINILLGLKQKYEIHHAVEISDEAIKSAVTLSERYIMDRFLPDKAIDLIDEASSRKHLKGNFSYSEICTLQDRLIGIEEKMRSATQNEDFVLCSELKKERDDTKAKITQMSVGNTSVRPIVTERDIADVVSISTGIPISKLTEEETQQLIHFEDTLSRRVIGQKEAVKAVAKAIKRARAGLNDPNRPIASFLFLGPTGVGKTELAKALAFSLFNNENELIRFDMSEYMDKSSASRFTGSSPGLVGYEEGGQLTEKVKNKPYSVLLFDEIEKAHSDIFNLLLQVLDDGRLTDGRGKTVNFKNTVIIMTSNIGSNLIRKEEKSFGESYYTEDYEEIKERQMDALKQVMRPEFINRFDEIVSFHPLSKGDIANIADIMFTKLGKSLAEKNISIILSPMAKQYIISSGTNLEYGARPLRRTIQNLLIDELSDKILEGKVHNGDSVNVIVKDGKLLFIVNAGSKV